MQKSKKLKLTILATLSLVVLIAIAGSYKKTDHIKHGEYLYPDLKSKLTMVDEIILDDSVDNLILHKNPTTNNWTAKNRGDYPVDFSKLKDLLIGITELKIIEQKTNNPDNFTSLSLNQIRGDEVSGAIRVEAKVSGEQPFLDVLLGKRSGVHLRSNYLDEIYVRKNNDNQVWLVAGKLPTAFNFANLVMQPLFKIPAAEIKELSIQHPKQPKLVLYKNKLEDKNYKIAGITNKQKVKAQYLANIMPATVANLTFEDVIPNYTDKTNWQNCSIITFKTFSNQEVELKIRQRKDLAIIKIASLTNIDNTDQARIKNWNYVFQMQDVENLFKTIADLVD
jgi:hypothetical protein